MLKNGQLFEHQMLLNIGINQKTAELSNRKENLTKKFSSIMSISYFMGKTFVFLPKFLDPSKVMTMMIMIKIMVQKQTAQTMYLNSRVLYANNSPHLYANSLWKLFLDFIFNLYEQVLFKKFFIFIYISRQTVFVFFKEKLTSTNSQKKICV